MYLSENIIVQKEKIMKNVFIAAVTILTALALGTAPAFAKNPAKKAAQASKKEAVAVSKDIKQSADKSSKASKKAAQALKKETMTNAQQAKKKAYKNSKKAGPGLPDAAEDAAGKMNKAKQKGVNTRAFRMQDSNGPINITGAAGRNAGVEETP